MNDETKTKKPNVKARIAPYTGSFGKLITLGQLLAALSALVLMVPFYKLWRIIELAVTGEDLACIRILGWQAVGITIVGMLLYVAGLICTHLAAFRTQANLRSALMRHIMALPLGTFDTEGTGKLRRVIAESTAATESYIAHSLPDQAVAVATPLGLMALFLLFDWRLGLLCLIPAVVGFLFMMSMMGKDMQVKMAEYQDALENMSNEAVEYVRGVPVVKTFGQTVYSFRRFKAAIDAYSKWATDYTISMRRPMVGFITSINAIFAVLIGAAYLFGHGGVTPELVSNVMYYILVTPLLTVTLTKIAYSGEAAMTLIDAMQRVDGILELAPLPEPEREQAPADTSISLEHVAYRYPGAERDALHDLSLTIPAGSRVALVGPSGGGKTTAAQLIARFFDVTGGCIRIGGQDIRELGQDTRMGLVSFVFQGSRLLKTSILENVRLAKPEATREEVLAALEKAQCGDILEKLPQGADTVLGTEGIYLSGGEQQRIAIARAILKDAPIVILDEATAFADPDNEAKVQAAFSAMAGDKTVIMIAHRLSTVVDADEIFVLKEGALAEHGTHEQLMAANGLYRRMQEEFSRAVQWKVGGQNA